jgi:membrane associated rhomboid family serine protease
MSPFGPRNFSMLPEIVKNLLIINGLLFLAKVVFQANFHVDLNDYLGLHYYSSEKFRIYQVITYMFMHGNFQHLFFNMFAVWMFGTTIESYWGPKKFLTYYILTGMGAAFLHYLIIFFQIQPDINLMQAFIQDPSYAALSELAAVHRFEVSPWLNGELYAAFNDFKGAYSRLQANPQDFEALNISVNFMNDYLEFFKNRPNVVGASGSLFGILLAFGMLFPNTLLMMLFLPVPIKAKYFVMGYGLIELFSGLSNNPNDNVAHFAHLGGMLFGFIIIKIWRERGIS